MTETIKRIDNALRVVCEVIDWCGPIEGNDRTVECLCSAADELRHARDAELETYKAVRQQ